jgi:hypothetical protein
VDTETLISLFNFLRGVSACLYFVVLGQTFYIVNRYYRVLRIEKHLNRPKSGLLPKHVVILAFVLIVALTECVVQNLMRIGHLPNYFAYFNTPLMGLTVYGLSLVMQFEYRRYDYLSQESVSDLIEI